MTSFRWINGVETKSDQDSVLGISRRANNARTRVLEHLKHSLKYIRSSERCWKDFDTGHQRSVHARGGRRRHLCEKQTPEMYDRVDNDDWKPQSTGHEKRVHSGKTFQLET